MSEELVSHKDLPYYIAASDVIFIQRKKILNSGNIPLAFLFKKIVIGPDIGNVGEILRETKNPTFCPCDPYSIVKALNMAQSLMKDNKGYENYSYAKQNMGLKKVANDYINIYNSLISNTK